LTVSDDALSPVTSGLCRTNQESQTIGSWHRVFLGPLAGLDERGDPGRAKELDAREIEHDHSVVLDRGA
jgi:hypothetical protein